MKKFDIPRLANTFGTPVLLTVLGGIMVLNPDSAAVLIARLLGWMLVTVCAIRLIPMVTGADRSGNQFLSVTGLALGIWLLCNPLVLASALGRFLGVLLLIRGGRNLYENRKRNFPGFPLMDCVCAGVGLLLILVPLSASRLAITLVGLVLVVLGVLEIVSRARGRKYLDQGDDPNIIDAL